MSERNQALADRFQNRESECQPADSGDFRRNAGVDWCRSLRTTVRTKAAETVETRGHYWPLQAGTERGFIQAIAHRWQLMAALGIFCPGPSQNYGSEGWGSNPSERARRVLVSGAIRRRASGWRCPLSTVCQRRVCRHFGNERGSTLAKVSTPPSVGTVT